MIQSIEFVKSVISNFNKATFARFAKKPTHKTQMMILYNVMNVRIGFMLLVMVLIQINWPK